MSGLSKAEFARQAGVSASAVSQAVRHGSLVAVEGRLDTTQPENRRWLELHRQGIDNRGHVIRPERVTAEPLDLQQLRRELRLDDLVAPAADDTISLDLDTRRLRDAFRLELRLANEALATMLGEVFINALQQRDRDLIALLTELEKALAKPR